MRYVLAYDVVSDSRRARFYKRLKRYMVPVQRSVFEGELPPPRLAAVEALIARELDLNTDAIRLYPLCRACSGLVRSYGVAPEIWGGRGVLIVG